MIRELQKADINKVTDIWLDTNVVTHSFISSFSTIKTSPEILSSIIKELS